MAYLPNEVPGPRPREHDKTFWDFCQQQELRFQRCLACRRFRHPPAPVCQHCRSFESEWIRAPESGEVFSFTIVHHPAHPAVTSVTPYNVIIVDFPECDHVRLVSNLIDATPEEIHIGMRVALVWETTGNGMIVPRFKAVLGR